MAHQDPLSMGFSRQEHWSGLLCPPPGTLPNPGMEPASLMSPALAGKFFTTTPPEKPNKDVTVISNCMNGEPVSPEETKDVKTQDTGPSHLRCKHSDLVVTDDETIIEITFMRINVKVS